MMAKSKPKKRARKRAPKKRRDWKPLFLSELIRTGCVEYTCNIVKITRSTVYDRREKDPIFKAAMDEAAKLANSVMLVEARRRAYEGTLKPVFQGGEEVGQVREYSDTLMIFLIKGKNPEYRDSSKYELTGANGGAIEIKQADVRIDELASAALALSAAREEGSDLPGDDSGKPVDSSGNQTGHVPEAD